MMETSRLAGMDSDPGIGASRGEATSRKSFRSCNLKSVRESNRRIVEEPDDDPTESKNAGFASR
jgi:hypothetical protein